MPRVSHSNNKRTKSEGSPSSNEPQYVQPTPNKKTKFVQSKLRFGSGSSSSLSSVGQNHLSVDGASPYHHPPIMVQSTLHSSGNSVVPTISSQQGY
ncbi:hypothetical protein FDP41_000383 [Naegleria fowleri]|uniref:Uncharacterized protein n=1 Tax=Naegleria fowleri TaxID=5763 RepID=A0A6A5CD51_NAEFO|nr:uncharacterized protein FDP41_000383 [Naegleria fowleri]KAF0984484.1 hypothetical protein FDP41_000383 [Naegleria fowleri]